jgi:hypothetical protein
MQKRMKQTRTIAKFWSPLLAQNADDIFDAYLSNLTNTYKPKDNIWT